MTDEKKREDWAGSAPNQTLSGFLLGKADLSAEQERALNFHHQQFRIKVPSEEIKKALKATFSGDSGTYNRAEALGIVASCFCAGCEQNAAKDNSGDANKWNQFADDLKQYVLLLAEIPKLNTISAAKGREVTDVLDKADELFRAFHGGALEKERIDDIEKVEEGISAKRKTVIIEKMIETKMYEQANQVCGYGYDNALEMKAEEVGRSEKNREGT